MLFLSVTEPASSRGIDRRGLLGVIPNNTLCRRRSRLAQLLDKTAGLLFVLENLSHPIKLVFS